jgi:hypothetical protein
MKQLLSNLLEALRNLGRHRSPPPQERRVRLQVESMEERMVPSTVAPKAAIPPSAPALTAPFPVQTDTTGGVTVVLPDQCQCIHGYKWRRRPRWPWAAPADQAHQLMAPVVPVQAYQPPAAAGNHLAVGGSEGVTVLTSVDGHLVVPPHGGPLPSELSAAIH